MDKTLLEQAKEKFPTLGPSERKFFEDVGEGQPADFTKEVPEQDNPAKAERWGSERTLKAGPIVWLFRNSDVLSTISGSGIQIVGARIEGDINLRYLSIPHPVVFRKCALSGDVELEGSNIQRLDFSGSHVCSIDCTASTVDEGIFFCDDFKANGSVCLEYAKTGGRLDCSGGQFIASANDALDADGIDVRGDVLLNDGFKAKGMVSLVGAKIGGNLECNQGLFKNTKNVALNAERLQVGGDVFFCEGSWRNSPAEHVDSFAAEGEVKLGRARIGGTLECRGGLFDNAASKQPAINAEGLVVTGDVLFHDGFRAKGKVDLMTASIGGNLECNKGVFICGEGGVALDVERANVAGDVFLCEGSWCDDKPIDAEGFTALGEVKLVRTVIGGDLNCIGGEFHHSAEANAATTKQRTRCSINARGLKITGSVLMSEGFTSDGKVDLIGATVGANLEFNTGKFINRGGVALDAERVEVTGDVFLCGGCWHRSEAPEDGHFQIEGNINLIGAHVGGTVKFTGASIAGPSETDITSDISLLGARIERELVWEKIVSPKRAVLDLRMAKVGRLTLSSDSWPKKDNMRLDGLVYDQLILEDRPDPSKAIDPKRKDIDVKIEWLQLQGRQFCHQPYQQLVDSLRKSGRDSDAKTVLVAKADDRAELTEMGFLERCWHWFLGKMIGYGHRPWRALIMSIIVIAAGTLVFWVGRAKGIIKPTKLVELVVPKDSGGSSEERDVSPDYPSFNPWVYSLDMFVPLVDLRQAAYWLPSAREPGQPQKEPVPMRVRGLRLYMWFHILAGWILSSLLVVGLSGLVKR